MARFSRFFFKALDVPVLRAFSGASIGVHVQHLARANLLLEPLPVAGFKQVAVQLRELPALFHVGEKENRKFFGKDIIG